MISEILGLFQFALVLTGIAAILSCTSLLAGLLIAKTYLALRALLVGD